MNAQNRRQGRRPRRHEDVARAQFASLIRAIPVAITSETVDGFILVWNAAAERLFGYGVGEMEGAPASLLVPPERQEEYRQLRERVVRERAPVRAETFRRRKDGSSVPVSMQLAPILGASGAVESICTIASADAAAAGYRDESHLLVALAASGAGAFRFDVANDRCDYDEAFAGLWELPTRQASDANSVLARVHPDDRQQLLAVLDRSTRAGTDFELEHRVLLPSGRERWLLSKGKTFADPSGRLRAMTGVSVDITHRRRAEEALRQSEERFRGMAEAIPSIVWESDAHGNALYKNRVWFEYTGEALRGRSEEDWLRFYHPEDRYRLQRDWARDGDADNAAALDVEARIQRHDGVYRWFRVRGAPIRDRGGMVVRWAGTCTDIDDQKRAAQAFEEADRHKNEFLAMLAHELRNPLASIRNAAEIVKMSGAQNPQQMYAIDVIGRQTERLGGLIADLLDLSNIARGKLALHREPCDLVAVVRDALEMNRPALERKGHELRLHLPERPLVLAGDASRLVQLTSNLIENAVKYTPEGGCIEIALRPQGDHALLQVRDTGRGIPPALLPRIFDLFVHGERPERPAEGGLGIGLALVREIAAMHGGSVTASNRDTGKGAEFTVNLPLEGGDAAKSDAGPNQRAAGEAPRVTRRILIVDDNRDYADSLAMLLQQMGHETLTLYSSTQALEQAAAFAPDVALLDLGLPGMDGAELCRRLRQLPELRHTTHVAISGFGQGTDRLVARDAGFAHHLLKPVRLAELLSIVAGADGEHAVAEQSAAGTTRGEP